MSNIFDTKINLCYTYEPLRLFIFDREQRSKVLKEALLLLFLAWNQVQKTFVGSKNVRGNKECSWEQKIFAGTKNVPTSQNIVHKVLIAMEAKCHLL